MIDHNGADVTKREQSCLLHWLLIRTEVLRSEHVAINQCLVRVHPVKDDHCPTLVEDRQV